MLTDSEFKITRERYIHDLKKYDPTSLKADISKVLAYGRSRWWVKIECTIDGCTYGKKYSFDALTVSFGYVKGWAENLIEYFDSPSTSVSIGGSEARNTVKVYPLICDRPYCTNTVSNITSDEYFPHLTVCGPCKKDLIRHVSEDRARVLMNRWLDRMRQKESKAQSKKQKIDGLVYLIQNGDTNYFKIGVTTSLQSRISSIQTSNPCKVGIVHTVRPKINAYLLENVLHRKYKTQNIHLEWFNLDKGLVEDCIKTMDSYTV